MAKNANLSTSTTQSGPPATEQCSQNNSRDTAPAPGATAGLPSRAGSELDVEMTSGEPIGRLLHRKQVRHFGVPIWRCRVQPAPAGKLPVAPGGSLLGGTVEQVRR